MSSIFCLGYEFETELDRDIFLAERTAELEINQLFLSEKLDSFFEKTETKSKESGGGLFGLMKRGINAIIEMLSKIKDKINEFLFGKQVNDDMEVSFDKNPNRVVELADKAIGEDVRLLNDVLQGKKGLDDVKDTCENHETVFDKIQPYVGPAIALATGKLTDDKIISKWEEDLSDAIKRNESTITTYAKDIALTTKNSNKREKINECVELIIKDIQLNSSRGTKSKIEFFKKAYIKKHVKDEISKRVDSLDSKVGGFKYRREKKAEIKRDEKEMKNLMKKKETLLNNERKNRDLEKKQAETSEKLSEMKAGIYTDVDRKSYVKKNTPLSDKLNKYNQLIKIGPLTTDERKALQAEKNGDFKDRPYSKEKLEYERQLRNAKAHSDMINRVKGEKKEPVVKEKLVEKVERLNKLSKK